MRAVTFVCRGIFLCDWKTTIADVDEDTAYRRHDLEHYLQSDHYLASRRRTDTVSRDKRNTLKSFSFQQIKLREKMSDKFIEFDEVIGKYRPLLDYAAMKRPKYLEKTGRYIQVECSTPIYIHDKISKQSSSSGKKSVERSPKGQNSG